MKKLSKLLALILSLQIATPAFAECDFSKDIQKTEDGRYSYTADCHKKVGKLVLDLKDREEQVAKLEKTIELKDLGIKTQEQRAELWMNTSLKLEDRVNTIERMNDTNKVLFFVGGVLLTGLAVWGAGQLAR